MGEAYIDLLKAFGFKEMQIWIATISALLFSSNLLGGILSGLMFANSKALRPRPLKERISFRLFLLSEVMLLIFVFFYHTFMIEAMTLSHIIYWVSAVMMMPLLAIIGSQAIQVTFSGRIKAKEEALKRQQQAQRAKRANDMEAGPGASNSGASNSGASNSGASNSGASNPAERAMAARRAQAGK